MHTPSRVPTGVATAAVLTLAAACGTAGEGSASGAGSVTPTRTGTATRTATATATETTSGSPSPSRSATSPSGSRAGQGKYAHRAPTLSRPRSGQGDATAQEPAHLRDIRPVRGLDGQVFLRLDLQHVGHPAKSAPERLHPSMPAVREVVRLGEFEGSSAVALGVRSRHGDPVRQGFRAFVSGQSLVIDVAHVGAWEAATR